MLQFLYHCCSPLHWTLSSSCMSLLYWGTHKWTQYSRYCAHQWWVEGKDQLPWAADNNHNAAVECFYLAARALCWLMFNLFSGVPQVLSCQAALQLNGSQPVLVPGADPPQVQDFFPLLNFIKWYVSVNIHIYIIVYVESIQILHALKYLIIILYTYSWRSLTIVLHMDISLYLT